MLVDMVSSTRNYYVIRFVDESGLAWFDTNLFFDWVTAVSHAKRMREKTGFCDSFSVQSISYWLSQL